MKMKWIAAIVSVAMTGVAAAQNLNAAGSTFVNPIMTKWTAEYAQAHPGVKINYQSLGSGAGIRQASDGTVDFGASDAIMTDEQIASAKVKLRMLPDVLGAVVPIYNIPGLSKPLNFSGDVIADIYLGKIKNWNDARLAKDNPGVKLPDKQILPVYRSESSGTTFILTDYLSKVSSDWASQVGKNAAVKWPAGVGAKGSEGVSGMVRQAPGAFGYVELIYATANHIEYGAVKNASGKYLLASPEGATAAAAAAAKTMPADYRVSITNAQGADSYPISSFSWFLIPKQFADSSKGTAVKGFLEWMLDKGESECASLGYAPLPAQVVAMERKTIAAVK